ncbi:outer membrane protein assembly factor BamB family protein [Cellulomonas triticagri]|uniref:Pyrrolo-quinoline quinone repeat domain-containing protein n=1 Tax=Cellulomonas triticagri TaxID=2483352 RepID=A0A3M2JMW0_9CELL|nr:PQQ-binding-like beta-propeller repeat protein [Cellulomonas triticagri]RMI13631.1 hypothetical protein EBM89_03785 [Cellulomonas triticagri]
MGRPRSAATMQDVEVVDVAGVGRAPVRPREAPRVTAPPRGQGRRRRWWAVAVCAVVALAAVEVAGRVSSVEERVAVPAGMLAALDGPPWTRWRVPAARTDDVVAAGDVLVVAAVRDRRFGLVAHDVASGETRWDRDLGAVAGTRPLTSCPHGGGDVGGVLLCVVEPPPEPRQPRDVVADAPVPAPARRWARVLALDAATGAPLGSWSTSGRLVGAGRVADDLVLLHVDEDGRARVSRHDGTTGALRWSHRADDPMRLRSGIVSGADLRVTPEFVLVQGWTATVLDVRDGSLLASSPPASFSVGSLGEEVFATWTGGAGVTVRDGQGEPLFTDRALFPALTATDGAPDDLVVLDEGGTVVGRSLPDGDELWRLDTYRTPRTQVAGRLLLLGVDGYQVVDARTGQVAWQTPERGLMWWSPVTDGEVVLGPGRSGQGRQTVEARGLADGRLLWTVPLPDDVREVSALGGHLLVRTREDLLLLR